MHHAIEPYHSGVFDLTHKLTVEKHGSTALITINHPPANTWDRDALIGLQQVLAHLNHDDDVHAVIVTGQGDRYFSAGIDLNSLADDDRGFAAEIAWRIGQAFEALRDFRGISIAAINGDALGAGLECALACDIRVLERQAQLGLPEASIGLLPCGGGIQALAWLVGESWCKRISMLGERIDALTAERIGLVSEVVDAGESRGRALLMANRLASQSPSALRAIKPLIDSMRARGPNTLAPVEREAFVRLFDSAEAREGIIACLEKRDAQWSRR